MGSCLTERKLSEVREGEAKNYSRVDWTASPRADQESMIDTVPRVNFWTLERCCRRIGKLERKWSQQLWILPMWWEWSRNDMVSGERSNFKDRIPDDKGEDAGKERLGSDSRILIRFSSLVCCFSRNGGWPWCMMADRNLTEDVFASGSVKWPRG